MKKKLTSKMEERGSVRIPIRIFSRYEGGKILTRARPFRGAGSDFMKSFFMNFIIIALIAGMNWVGLFNVGQTVAYYNDTETSGENAFNGGFLDFSLSQYSFESSIGLDEIVSESTVIVNGGGIDFQYVVEAEEISDEDGFCGALNLQAKRNGVEQYTGDLMSLFTSTSTALGTWEFNIELPVDETSFTNGEECVFDVVFRGWQTNIGSYDSGGFSDEERMSFALTAGKMVVLNEFLPRPDGVAYGFDFGNDSSDMPQGEWVELYNNSTGSIDLAGWYIRDATDGEGNKTEITAFNTAPATTVIGGKSWLVVYMNKSILNNTGDTVRLFDGDNNLIDLHLYDDPDFCEIEPTPGDENSTDASGSCGSVPPNKSYARIPDGIGDWVDPIPTPGRVNLLVEAEEIVVAQDIGFPHVSVSTDDTSIPNEPAFAVEANTNEIQTADDNVAGDEVSGESENAPIAGENTETEILPMEDPAAEIISDEITLPVENNGDSGPAEEIAGDTAGGEHGSEENIGPEAATEDAMKLEARIQKEEEPVTEPEDAAGGPSQNEEGVSEITPAEAPVITPEEPTI